MYIVCSIYDKKAKQTSTQKQNNTNTKWNKQNKNNKYYLVTNLRKKKKNPNHDSRKLREIEDWKLKFAIFENFTNHGESIRDINRGSREWKKNTTAEETRISKQIMKKNGERQRKKTKCMRGSEKGSSGQTKLQCF